MKIAIGIIAILVAFMVLIPMNLNANENENIDQDQKNQLVVVDTSFIQEKITNENVPQR
jgi:uncharacterized membrane protein